MPSTVPSASYLDSFHITDNADLRAFAREVRTNRYPRSTCDDVPVAPAKLVYAYRNDGDVASAPVVRDSHRPRSVNSRGRRNSRSDSTCKR